MIYLHRLRTALLTWLLGPTYICPLDGTPFRSGRVRYEKYLNARFTWVMHDDCQAGPEAHCYHNGIVVCHDRQIETAPPSKPDPRINPLTGIKR